MSTAAPAASATNSAIPAQKEFSLPPSTDTVSVPVNRKKQKRRQKQAARLAAERQSNGHISPDAATQNGSSPAADPEGYHSDEFGDVDQEQLSNGDANHKDDQDSVDAHDDYQYPGNGSEGLQKPTGRKSKKKKGKKGPNGTHAPEDETATHASTPSVSMSHPLPPTLPSHLGPRPILKPAKTRSIWNTSTQEERENIKTFWLELGEEERRQLVKVEKDAVLKKMKEQQRHSCSCTVCGRKRTAIEEELEVLYDAYYEELEQYANHNQGSFEKGPPIVPPPRLYQPPLRSPGQHTRTQGQFHPSRGRIHEVPEEEDDDDLEEDYDEDEEDDEPYSDEDSDDEDDEARAARADFFAFGNSLTVKDGILTVADDLLKNDGKHFIDMMEQLAERRMQREEDTQYGIAAAHQSLHSGHNHGPFDEEDYDEEEDEDYDSQEDEDYEEDEMDTMTEEQRMEEGRRMFQIFAARMFEQRVLTAYREKVAEQRQQKLIEELLEEETRNEQRNAKKAREAQKRKDKKKLQKQAKEEERARREAEKAAEEAAAKAEQEKKLEEQRKKREEQRKKKEADRKAQEEERARKEAEKLRRQREERERQAEVERKQREEKKRREEARRKEKEERELREKKAKEEQLQKDAAKAEEAAKEREKREYQAKRTSPFSSNQHPQISSSPVAHSPHIQSGIPVVPKAPTPARPRQPSQQDSHTSSPHSQPASTDPSQASVSPRSMPISQSSGASSVASKHVHGLHAMFHQPQPSAPLSPLGRSIPPGFSAMNGLPPGPPGLTGILGRPPMAHELPVYPPHSGPFIGQFRGYPTPNGIPAAPGINGARAMPPGRGFPLESAHGFPFHGQQQIPGAFSAQQSGLPHGHSRQPSGSFERSPLEGQTQPMPISRPSPIKRPSSTQQDQRKNGDRTAQRDVDDLSAHLGSSALLDDTDVPFASTLSQSLPGATAPGPLPGPARASFGGPSLFPDPLSTSGWSNNAFGSGVHHRAHTSRPVAIRLLVIQACKQLNTMSPFKGADGFHDVSLVLRQVEQLRPQNEPSISLKEMLDICDTEGSTQNGGGSFSTKKDETGEFVKFEPDNNSAASGHRGSIVPGEIGSPVPSSSLPAFGGIGTPSVLRQFSSPPMGF
ncbi:putative stress response protein Nst1 [Aspergillus clavatus NRRL 1]|uniref:Stress response protein nst1 n=1 Tax=Aspergillus clavatus (strain ATCC 1007 / CBS 513.65 / DSM 816 / NCTC 3887 / NRRL 1 / QM 1276 / 107) TaxID=344612 RepID=NST1_ASPCL|nr:stress response protein Nst1, putative [Aspergillus clavatus NRRL 1]A1CKE0.1 RecName: Full=Stress response protein nst1 [Aspergillus clavatus NRRL 1]EAW09614.1 stress response protein Nst1, putative [Aspergillus clavatus NRRL 1]